MLPVLWKKTHNVKTLKDITARFMRQYSSDIVREDQFKDELFELLAEEFDKMKTEMKFDKMKQTSAKLSFNDGVASPGNALRNAALSNEALPNETLLGDDSRATSERNQLEGSESGDGGVSGAQVMAATETATAHADGQPAVQVLQVSQLSQEAATAHTDELPSVSSSACA